MTMTAQTLVAYTPKYDVECSKPGPTGMTVRITRKMTPPNTAKPFVLVDLSPADVRALRQWLSTGMVVGA